MTNYKKSGVDSALGNRVVDRLSGLVKQTYDANVLGGLGHFGAFYELPMAQVDQPILVSCTDGVGTKLKIAFELETYDTIGIDLVAMCVNDLICSGATPLFFLDYYACCKLNGQQVESILSGMVTACQASGLSLVGGEIAEMGDCYRQGEFDLAGFCVGMVDKKKMITGQAIEEGHHVYGLVSSGLHANGFSLVRHVLTPTVCCERGIDRHSLLTPTTLYVKPIQGLLANQSVTGIAHITGGGIIENVARILPKNVSALIKQSQWQPPDIFEQIQLAGHVTDDEMFRVFNMGIGMVVIVPDPIDDPAFIKLGKMIPGNGTVELL